MHALPARPPRLAFLDAARGVAILLALLAHAFLTFDLKGQLEHADAAKVFVNGAFRAATPTFLLLFGVFLEWVYAVAMARDGVAVAARRLVHRAMLCQLALIGGAITAAIAGTLTWTQVPFAAVNLQMVPHITIMGLYAVLLLLAIPLIWLRLRYGLLIPLIGMALPWLLDPLLGLLTWPPLSDDKFHQPPTMFLSAFWLGYPQGAWIHGSVFHNLCLICGGMLLGNILARRQQQGRDPLPWRVLVVAMCGIGAVLIGLAWWFGFQAVPEGAASGWRAGLREALTGHVGAEQRYRWDNSWAYWALATLSALAVLALARRIWAPERTAHPPGTALILPLGRHSLLAFGLGNIVLNLIPLRWSVPLWLGIAGTVAFLAALLGGMWWYDRRQAAQRARLRAAPVSASADR